MPYFPNRLKKLRTNKSLTQKELATILNVSQNAIFNWENGKREPSIDMLRKIADYFNVSVDYLIGLDNKIIKVDLFGKVGALEDIINTQSNVELPAKRIIIPVLGRIAAGMPLEAVENIIDTEEISEDMAKTGEFFGLHIKGDSMEPDIHNGDTVIVRQQDDAENDEIVIALINSNDGVCKRLKKYENSIALVSLNANYEPMYFNNTEIMDKPVKIIGKVVELRRKF